MSFMLHRQSLQMMRPLTPPTFGFFQDKFDRPDENLSVSKNWIGYNEPDRLLSLVSHRVRSVGSGQAARALYTSKIDSPYYAEVDVIVNASTHSSQGASADIERSEDGSDGYIFHVGRAGDWSLRRLTSGSLTTLNSGTIRGPGAFYTVRLERDGTLLRCILNGTLIIAVNDSTHSSGLSGFGVVPPTANRAGYEVAAFRCGAL